MAFVELFDVVERLNACFGDDLLRAIGVEGRHVHAEAFGDAGDVAADLTEGVDAELLAFELAAALAVIAVAGHHDGHTEHEFGNGVGVLAGGVLNHYAMGCGSGEVDIVVAGACAHNDLEILGGVEYLVVDFVGADNKTFDVGDSFQKFSFLGVFFKKNHLHSGAFDDFADAVDGCCCERFFGCDQYLCHGLTVFFEVVHSLYEELDALEGKGVIE